MWQAMLLSIGLPPTKHILIHGFINLGGQKMSKSLGNVVSPHELVRRFGVDAVRFFVAKEFNQFEDTDISINRLTESYNANLANGLGNLTSRIMKLAEMHLASPVKIVHKLHQILESYLNNFEIQKAANHIWSEIGELDREIQAAKPWESGDAKIIKGLVEKLAHIGYSLAPFMPETSAKILLAIETNQMPKELLFPRKD
jgi:methionyl-tRNA synthetase